MQVISEKQEKKKSEYCVECNSKFRTRSNRYYCCNKDLLVCESCHINFACKICKKLRNTKVISCISCKKSNKQSDTFYDFKADCFVCSKCISNKYIQAYENMIRMNLDPKACMVRVYGQSQYYIEELITFFKNRCFCCLKLFNNNAYEMKFGVRICDDCLQANFDLALPKLITCVQCFGYIRDLSQIKFSIGPTQVFCTYCAVDEVKISNFKNKKQQAGSTKSSSLKSKSSLKDSGLVIPASQMSKFKADNQDFINEGLPEVMKAKLIKVISRGSVEEQSLDIRITVNRPTCSINCALCNSYFDEKSFFQLSQNQVERLKMGKQPITTKKSNKICLMCFTQVSYLIKSKITNTPKFQQIPNFFSNKELASTAPSLQIPSLQSAKTFPTSPRSPRGKIFAVQSKIENEYLCHICNAEYGSVKIDNKRICRACYNNRNVKK